MVDDIAYRKLVDENYKKQHNSDNERTDLFEWCNDCKEINLWTYWQGRDAKDVKIMVVGQDWGNPSHQKNIQTMKNIKSGKNYFYNQNAVEEMIYPTDRSLCALFDSIGYNDIINNRYDDLFFTNFYLKYRTEKSKETGNMSRTNMMRDAKNFADLVAAINPKVIICLGKLTYECVVDAIIPEKKCRVGTIVDYCNMIDTKKNYTDIDGIRVFGMVHCGASGVNVNRKKGTNTDKSIPGIELMKKDWMCVKEYLESK